MGWSVGARHRATLLLSLVTIIVACGVLSSPAGAVVIKMSDGKLAGITPLAGVSPASIPGNLAKTGVPTGFAAADTGALTYQGGPVLHGSSPYLIFWDPGNQISAASKALYARYFTDAAAASGQASNVFSVDRQFTDTTGIADYNVTYAANHAITDTQAYPTTGNCTATPKYSETVCLFDVQLVNEINRVVQLNGLPMGISGNAPIYFIVTPPNVNSCESNGTSCADNVFCAYHSYYTLGPTPVLYANIPTVLAANSPKNCQNDTGTLSTVQSPNGNPVTDVALKYLSHEYNETITDPEINAWYDPTSGGENGDNCNGYASPSNPPGGTSANAFAPTLGGSASSGTLYNQLINGNQYYTQSEWSNGDTNCQLRPTANSLSAGFTAPGTVHPAMSVSFNPSSSSNGAAYSSASWSFGDGGTSFGVGAPATTTHSFAATGTYTVKLTEVDQYGNLSSVSHQITVANGPTAAFTYSPTHPLVNTSVSFDGSTSTDTSGTINSYSWDFGDGGTATGVTATHTFTTAGSHTVTLTVGDGTLNGATTHIVVLDSPPAAAFTYSPTHPLPTGTVSFDGSTSSETGGSIASFSWNYGDSTAAGTGATPTHAYASAGSYTVVLTVTDQDGHTATTSHTVVVDSVPSASFSVTTTSPKAGSPVAFDATTSGETNGSIASYSWDFGDASALGSGAAPSHTYSAGGTYTAVLTVTDQDGHTATVSHTVTVSNAPIAAFSYSPPHPLATAAVAFDGTASHETGGSITGYSWDFGDSSSATTSQPSHSYAAAGSYTVTLIVTDGSQTSTTTHQVTVDPAPSATFTFTSAQPAAGDAVAFDGSGSTGAGVSYSWNYGDSTANGTGATPTHAYTSAGSYTVALTVSDQDGHTATVSHAITVAVAPSPPPPTPPTPTPPTPTPPPTPHGSPTAGIAVLTAQPVGDVQVSFSGAKSTDATSGIVSYHWSFGDGGSSSAENPAHMYAKTGSYTVTLTITDAAGAASTAVMSVTVGSASVTGASAKPSGHAAAASLTISGPGTLTIAKKNYAIRQPGTFKLKLKLSPAQLNMLHTRHRLVLKLKEKFAPKVGHASSRTLSIKLKG